jgi:competence protein ComEC
MGRTGAVVQGWVVVAAIIMALVLLRSRWLILSLMVLALLAGVWRADAYAVQQRQLTSLIGQTVTVRTVVADDPGVDPRGFENYKLGNLVIDGRPTPGTLSVYMYVFQVQRGYRVEATGKVKPGFGNQAAELSYPQVTILSRQQSELEQLRQRFFTGIKTALPEPMASFGLGLLVGLRALIPKPMQAQLALVGLSHLVAVSGYNLTIIVAAAHRLLERFGRGIALAASLWLIGGFLAVTGASPSIVRASLVAVLALAAGYYGRRFHPVTLIALAAAVTAWFSPTYLTDLGWLLSFLAFFGILVLAPAVEARMGNPKSILLKLFVESTAAQVMTIPLIMYSFSQLSIVSPVTNLIVLPLVPLAMLLSFVAGLAGMVAPAFAGWLAWPADLMLRFMLGVVDWFAHLPLAGISMGLSLAGMLLVYGVIVAVTWALKRSNGRGGRQESSDRLIELRSAAKLPN